VQRNVRWQKPPEGYLKLNCYASFIAETKTGSWGFLIRDHDGEVVMSGRRRISYALSAFHAELIACMQGVQVASNLGIGNLILETDAINVQGALQSQSYDVRPEGGFTEELNPFASLNFSNFTCNFLDRARNKAAHVLVNLGYDCVKGEALISSAVPDDIVVIISDDLSGE
jgi:ribonuclease HI